MAFKLHETFCFPADHHKRDFLRKICSAFHHNHILLPRSDQLEKIQANEAINLMSEKIFLPIKIKIIPS